MCVCACLCVCVVESPKVVTQIFTLKFDWKAAAAYLIRSAAVAVVKC